MSTPHPVIAANYGQYRDWIRRNPFMEGSLEWDFPYVSQEHQILGMSDSILVIGVGEWWKSSVYLDGDFELRQRAGFIRFKAWFDILEGLSDALTPAGHQMLKGDILWPW